jgi:hypothetical protein
MKSDLPSLKVIPGQIAIQNKRGPQLPIYEFATILLLANYLAKLSSYCSRHEKASPQPQDENLMSARDTRWF